MQYPHWNEDQLKLENNIVYDILQNENVHFMQLPIIAIQASKLQHPQNKGNILNINTFEYTNYFQFLLESDKWTCGVFVYSLSPT